MSDAENVNTETGPTVEAAPEPKPEKRGRGRPPKDPALKEEPVKGKASAKSGPKKNRETLGENAIASIAQQIKGLHEFVALATGLPIMQIDDKEAKLLAGGLVAVSNEYGFELSGKAGATLQLVAALGVVYVPRLLMVKAMRDAARNRAGQTVEGEATHVSA